MPPLPQGYRLSGIFCGIKKKVDKLDLSLIVSDRPASAAGVYTQNLVFAAPVALDRARTPGEGFRVVVINSGNANACTGDRGLGDAVEMARLAGAVVGASGEEALVMSTGVIGNFLPMEKVATGIQMAAAQLGTSDAHLDAAGRGILTTDSGPKIASRSLTLGGREIRITGLCKGAAMIGPNMATMLGLVFTDANVPSADLQRLLTAAVDRSFNCISVDGHMSTNDTVLVLANGAAGGSPLSGADLAAFGKSLTELCAEIARMIPADGEGCTHIVTLDITGCASAEAARTIARSVADSPLVKTAIAGGDPNWGRIVSAAGYAGIPFDPAKVGLRINHVELYRSGAPIPFDDPAVAKTMRENREVHVELSFGEGSDSIRFWTTDLTAEYVRLNADYRT